MITIVYRCHETSNFSFLAYYPVISLLLKQQVKFKCPVSCPVRSVKKSQQLQKSPLHSRTRLRAIACIGGGPFGVVNFASHFICFQIPALPLILSASKYSRYNFRGWNKQLQITTKAERNRAEVFMNFRYLTREFRRKYFQNNICKIRTPILQWRGPQRRSLFWTFLLEVEVWEMMVRHIIIAYFKQL